MNEKVLSYNEIMAILDRVAKQQEEFGKRLTALERKHEASLRRQPEGGGRKCEDSWVSLDRQLAASAREFDRGMKELSKKIGNHYRSDEVDLIFNKFKKRKMFGGVAFDEVLSYVRGVRKDKRGKVLLDGEFDVVMYNHSEVALIDVKYRVRHGDLDYLIDEQLPKFKRLFPRYRKFKVYLGLAGLSFVDGVTNLAKKNGVGIIRMDENIVRVDDKGAVAK